MELYHFAAATMLGVLLCGKVSAQCNYNGQVRLVNGSAPNEGRVEVCVNYNGQPEWATVCGNRWNSNGAEIVCRQLGYTPKRAQAVTDASFGQGTGSIMLYVAECEPSTDRTLSECRHYNYRRRLQRTSYCSYDAGIRCEQIVKNLSATYFTTPSYSTALINVKLQNNKNSTNLFQIYIVCYNRQHGVYVYYNTSLLNETSSFTTRLRGLFPSSFYICCTSAVYYPQFIARGVCINIETPELFTTTESSDPFTTVSLSITSNQADSRISNQTETKSMTSVRLVGGTLGFIIAVLLILLLLSLIAFMCLLQSNFKKYRIPKPSRRSTIADLNPNTSTLPVEQNLSYTTTPPSPTRVGSSDRQDYQHEEYSRLQF